MLVSCVPLSPLLTNGTTTTTTTTITTTTFTGSYLSVDPMLLDLALDVPKLPLQLIASLDVAHILTLESYLMVVQLKKTTTTSHRDIHSSVHRRRNKLCKCYY